MRNIIIGTAGHIDHGKTTLIKNLTGIETDTLPEESKRGMTINLGFAYYKLPNGKKVGIIDVPGHEKFIKNMVAGASGIDFILLVIACDDGIMPQTIEHANICSILGVDKGLIVLTKRDLVVEDRVDEIKKDIKHQFKDSFLSRIPIVEVSSKDSESFSLMKKILNEEIEKLNLSDEKEDSFRMAVDRVFSVKGFGTVVTGTTISGVIKEGDTVTLYPQNTKHKVKGIQNHWLKVEALDAGNRCALNLSGLEASEVKRGDIISKDSTLVISNRIDCIFTLLNTNYKLKNNGRIRLHIGTTEVIGRAKLLEDDEINTTKPSFIQLELENEIVAVTGDIGVIRNYSPLDTIGGIKILNSKGVKTKKRNTEYIDRLKSQAYGNKNEKIISLLNVKKQVFLSKNDIENELGEKLSNLDIQEVLNTGKVKILQNLDIEKYISILELERIKEKTLNFLDVFHKENQLKKGVLKSELKSKLFKSLTIKEFNSLIELLKNENILDEIDGCIALKDFKIKLSKEQKIIKDEILTIYKKFAFSPEYYDNIIDKINERNKNEFIKVHNYLVESKLLTSIGENLYVMRGFYIEAEKRLRDYLDNNGKITLKEYKDILEVSRKDALNFLEKFDSLEITRRVEDYRVYSKNR